MSKKWIKWTTHVTQTECYLCLIVSLKFSICTNKKKSKCLSKKELKEFSIMALERVNSAKREKKITNYAKQFYLFLTTTFKTSLIVRKKLGMDGKMFPFTLSVHSHTLLLFIIIVKIVISGSTTIKFSLLVSVGAVNTRSSTSSFAFDNGKILNPGNRFNFIKQ